MGGRDQAFAVALQRDGKFLVAGLTAPPLNDSNDDLVLARFNSNGLLDTRFGTGGRTIVPLEAASAIAIYLDGRIVVASDTCSNSARGCDEAFNGGVDFAAVRFTPNGSLDTTFGGDGKVTTNVSGGLDLPLDIAVQRDGKVVVGGLTCSSSLLRCAIAEDRFCNGQVQQEWRA